jgi:hypothetical protein
MGFFAFPMPAIINGNHSEVVRESFDTAAPTLSRACKTVDKQKRFTFALCDVMDLHSIGIEEKVLGKRRWNEQKGENES